MFRSYSTLKKAAVATAILTLAPVVPMMTASGPQAHTDVFVGGSVVVSAPAGVFGFSYGDPYVLGHVHRYPVACAHGPLYYFPSYRVYGHYAPRYSYYAYSGPVRHHSHGHYVKAWKHRDYHPVRFDRHPGRGRGHKIRGHRH